MRWRRPGKTLLGEEVPWSGAAWLTTGLFWLQNRPRVRGRRRCGRSRQIARTASACAAAGERGTDGESEAEEGARLGKDRAGADPRRPTRLCEDSAGARGALGGPEGRLGQGRPHPRPMWGRSLEDARRSDRSATGRADRPLPPLTRQRRSVLERARQERAPDRPSIPPQLRLPCDPVPTGKGMNTSPSLGQPPRGSGGPCPPAGGRLAAVLDVRAGGARPPTGGR